MKIFIDSANLQDIENALRRGFIRGITTNPSILAKEPKGAFKDHIKKIVELIQKYQPDTHLSVEVFSKDKDEILRQARDFVETFRHPHLSVKVQVGWDELEAIRQLAKEGISINCTCCMTVSQAVIAAASGARYVSLFWGRIRDISSIENKLAEPALTTNKLMDMINHSRLKKDYLTRGIMEERHADPAYVVGKTREILNQYYPKAEIIAGSMRTANDVLNSALAGAHIVTVPPKFFLEMISHFKTDEVVQQFLNDFSQWMS